jgi:Arc/MetJ-type ribon-helix-helix transcriptional regulator
LHYNALQNMQEQITVRLPVALRAALRRASRRLRRKDSDVVRMALEAFLQSGARAAGKPAERVRDLIGSLESGVPDLAARHREYVLEAVKRGR